MGRLKVGAVSYLNTKPLVYGLDSNHDLEVFYDLPGRLADRLADGELDVALIPVIEAVVNPIYTIVSNACIACYGPVRSVKLFSRVDVAQIKTLALDEGSRTSAALAKVILHHRYSNDPKSVLLPIEKPWQETEADAVLVIGDRAMKPLSEYDSRETGDFQNEIDLGDYWHRWTGFPFVFAVWAVRPGTEFGLDLIDRVLSVARDEGMKNVDEICKSVAPNYGLSESDCRDYLTKHLKFRLGQDEKTGLNQFIEFAKQYGLLDNDLNLQFHDCKNDCSAT